MARNQYLSLFCVLFLFCVSTEFITNADDHQEKKIYIVYMGALPRKEVQPAAHYASILQGVGVSEQSIIRSYTKSFGGFAVNITEKQQQALAAHNEVISVFPSKTLKLRTTESWDFMGFPLNVSRSPTIESDMIIGFLDTGIWPISDSFNDTGLSSPPKKWKGACSGGKDFKCNKNPEATILTSELSVNKTAPVVASFSSRGPNTIVPDILKPDITAPGVNILAAFTTLRSPSGYFKDHRVAPFSVLSGTSMACPHVAGAAAYVKSHHLDWSPSAIKSALMTTAKQMNASQSGDGNKEFSFGSGFLDPAKALNPGLVYETTKMDYAKMLCNIGYDNNTLRLIAGDDSMCPEKDASTPKDLNYPTMTAKLNQTGTFSVKFPRTVTNVGQANSTYKAIVSHIREWNITVEPNVLSFMELNEKKSFVVSISGKISEEMISASLEWSDGINIVRNPIVVYTT